MASFKSSTVLQTLQPQTTTSVTFATSSQTESLPSEQKWWTTKFALGPRRRPPKDKSTRPTVAHFASPSAAVISYCTFAPYSTTAPRHFQLAVVSGPRVALYGGSSNTALSRALSRLDNSNEDDESDADDLQKIKPDRTIGTGGHLAYCASYNDQKQLIAIGCEGGVLKICDTTSRATLRTFTTEDSRHTIRSVQWIDQKKLVSAGDDAVIRLWDISGETVNGTARPLLLMRGHGDSIRSFVTCNISNHGDGTSKETTRILGVSGSYDHTLRVWDLNDLDATTGGNSDERCLSIMDHGAPVECLLVLDPSNFNNVASTSNTPLIASSGSTIIKLWNPLIGTCVATIPTKHNKTITALCLVTILQDDNGERVFHKRLVSAGLDGLIRIHSADTLFTGGASITLPYVHGVKTRYPITALAISLDSSRFVIGTSTGLLTVHQRAKTTIHGGSARKEMPDRSKRLKTPRAGTYAFFTRGANEQADAADHVVVLERRRKLSKHDQLLKQFRYGDALDEALNNRDPNNVIAVIEELGRRKGLTQALSNRDEETLEPILAFTAGFISNPRNTAVLIGVAEKLCNIYKVVIGQSETIDEYFEKLHKHVREECKAQRTLLQLVGQIDAVMYAAETTQGDNDNDDDY